MSTVVNIGTRKSQLALAQTQLVVAALQKAHPHHRYKQIPVVTRGDRDQTSSLQVIGGQGAFVKAIEQALLDRRVDLAVHSLKDVTTTLPDGLVLAAILSRASPYDCLLSRQSLTSLAALPQGARIGTNASRRQGQLLHLRPDFEIVPIRGNVDTRVRKLDSEHLDAVVLAEAGLARLDLALPGLHRLSLSGVLLPAPGQGAIAVECRATDLKTRALLAAIDDASTHQAVTIERAFLRRLGGSCRFPFGGFAQLHGDQIDFTGMVASRDGTQYFHEHKISQDSEIGVQVAEDLIAQGALNVIQ